MSHRLALLLLGPPRMERRGELVITDTRKATALLAYLAVGGERLSRDVLAAFLWPEFNDQRAKAALRRTLSTAKSAVGSDALSISREALAVNSEGIWCDVSAFRQSLFQVMQHHPSQDSLCDPCLERLESAVALYRDDFMAGFSLRDSLPFDDWQLQQGQSLSRELSQALAKLTSVYAIRGRYQDGIDVALRWLQLDPLREEAYRQLMSLHAWSGQRSAALMQYRECVRTLETELGVPPLDETTELYEAIQADQLPPPAIQTPMPAEPQPESPTPGQSAVAGSDQVHMPEAQPPALMSLMGRETELAAIRQMYADVNQGGRLLVVAGEAGIGKSWLAQSFLSSITGAKLWARCYEGESHLAYAPFVQAIRDAMRQPETRERLASVTPAWLAEASRLLPELAADFPGLPDAPALDWPGASSRFMEGLSQVLAALLGGSVPGVLWLDDVQWLDIASLDLLAYLVRRRQQPYLILTCWQVADQAADHRLHQLLAECRRDGRGQLLSLSRLDADEVSRFIVETAATLPQAAAISQRLYEETEGLPFLISAYLHVLAERPTDETLWQLPPSARDLFQSRLAQVSETQRQILQAASIIGRAVSFDLLLAVSGRSEDEAVPAVEGLVARQLLLEQEDQPAYEFYHHKLRDLIYEETSLIRRRLLHRRTAAALTGLQTEAVANVEAARIANHYQLAGQEAEAADYYRLAGDHARALFAHRDALEHYRSALALGHSQPALLHEACGDIRVRLGQYATALSSYQRAAALCPSDHLPRLEHRIGQVYYRRGDWIQAERHFLQAEQHQPEAANPDDLARLYIDWSHTAYRSGKMDQAMQHAQKAASLASQPQTHAQTQNLMGVLVRSQGDLIGAMQHFQRSLDEAVDHELLGLQIAAMNNLALVAMDMDQPEKAEGHLLEALQQCHVYGDRHWEAALHNNLADLLHQTGQAEAARTEVKKAVTIYAEIGRETGDWQPEIWKLTEW